MIDQDKMRALAAQARRLRVAATDCRSCKMTGAAAEFDAAADAIDALLAEVEANKQMLTETFERQEAGFERCFEALRGDGDTERSWSSLVLEINHLRAELEAAAADKREIERLRRISWLIGSIYVHGNFVAETANERELELLLRQQGPFWDALSEFDAALAQRQGEGS